MSGRTTGRASVLELGGVAPELFEGVVVAGRPGEDVDHEEAVVHEDPLAVGRALDAERADAGPLSSWTMASDEGRVLPGSSSPP